MTDVAVPCKYCGLEFVQKVSGQEFCRSSHRHKYRHQSKKWAGVAGRCPHTFKQSFGTADDARAFTTGADNAIHNCYECRCGSWHYGREQQPVPEDVRIFRG